ncbi:MAG: hypothetical protein WC455_09280 [Dehalococcoidia bacterium]|jgi:hypothetical protein
MREHEPTDIGTLHKFIERMMEKTKIREVQNRLDEISFYDGYAEPGYEDPASGIIATGDWNSITISPEKEDHTLCNLGKMLEYRFGVNLEWSDEWYACDECGKLVRTSPDSYGWTGSYWIQDGSLTCHQCVKSDESIIREYLESFEGKVRQAMTIDINPEDYGYIKLNSEAYEHGLYGGQNDDPAAIAKVLKEKGATRILFKIDSVGQFDLDFSVYIHESKYDSWLRDPVGKGVDPAVVMQAALAGAR